MIGYEGSHQDWLEGQASDQLEREEYERSLVEVSRFDDRAVLQGTGYEIVRVDGAWEVWTDRGATFTDEQMVRLAHAILAEVEIAQKESDNG